MPGVSTSARPWRRIALGAVISTRSTCFSLPGLPCSDTHPPSSVDGDLIGDGLVALAAADDRGRLFAVAHERDRGGGEVVVDGAHIGAQQAVDEGALALLELADDAHDRRRPVQPRARGRRAADEVVTAERPQHADQLADDAVERRRLWLGDGGSHSRPSNMLSKESSI